MGPLLPWPPCSRWPPMFWGSVQSRAQPDWPWPAVFTPLLPWPDAFTPPLPWPDVFTPLLPWPWLLTPLFCKDEDGEGGVSGSASGAQG